MHQFISSKKLNTYFETLQKKVDLCYQTGRKARRKGFDPSLDVESPQAEDLAGRVEMLLKPFGIKDIAPRIRELSKTFSREEVAFMIAKEVAVKFAENTEKALENAVRVGLAVLTEGVLVAPLEGISGVKIGRNYDADRSSYATIYYAGPIRAAGGTVQALSVLIADVVRRELNLNRYLPTESEIGRYKEELPLYNECTRLQYLPSEKEIEFIISNTPICIDGEGTEDVEISGYRNLKRVSTNKVRGGACLVIAEGLCQKASKIQKYVKQLRIDGWQFIDKYLSEKQSENGTDSKLTLSHTYLKDAIAGRPIFAYPNRTGGFRLRYGRTRTTGLAAVALNPATMYVLDEFIAVGTQLKLERPGKAGAVTPTESIEGPIVLLNNGDLIAINTVQDALMLKDKIVSIVDLGEILIPYGDFLENNHPLLPSPYCEEWWQLELEAKGVKPDMIAEIKNDCLSSPEKAFEIAKKYNVGLHPHYNLFWHEISIDDVNKLAEYFSQHGSYDGKCLRMPQNSTIKSLLIKLGALHRVVDGNYCIDSRYSYPLIRCLGLKITDGKLHKEKTPAGTFSAATDYISTLAGVKVYNRAPIKIGAKMGRPEKAGIRKLKPPPHVLFPVSQEVGTRRLVLDAAAAAKIKAEICVKVCERCGEKSITPSCRKCNAFIETPGKPKTLEINVHELLAEASKKLNISEVPKNLKGVQGLVSSTKTPEPLEKGILRAIHQVFVFKDGTSRFDMTDLPITHFRPSEINLSVEKAHKLGYTHDWQGNLLESPEQLVEMMPQDIILAYDCILYLMRVANFIDDLLTKFYGLEPFYKIHQPDDLIDHLVVGLAPHTSNGVVARIIGYTDAKANFAHPYFHAAKRRNADGDEDCVFLLLDGLLNFSVAYLPATRGGFMDAPLVLTTRIDPNEIDKEAHNIDLCRTYPLRLYEASLRYAHPREIENEIDNVGKRIGTEKQYEDLYFTHHTNSITAAPLTSYYKKLSNVEDMIDKQLGLQSKIAAVDATDAVAKLINHHFLPDIIGNLKKFSTQQVRCPKCNKKYRRVPLSGCCTNNINGRLCGNPLTLTLHEGSVRKYVETAKKLSQKYGVSRYVQERVALIESAINSLFESDKVKKYKLEDFM